MSPDHHLGRYEHLGIELRTTACVTFGENARLTECISVNTKSPGHPHWVYTSLARIARWPQTSYRIVRSMDFGRDFGSCNGDGSNLCFQVSFVARAYIQPMGSVPSWLAWLWAPPIGFIQQNSSMVTLEAPNLAPKTSLKNSLILSQGGGRRGKCANINKSRPPPRFSLIFGPIQV